MGHTRDTPPEPSSDMVLTLTSATSKPVTTWNQTYVSNDQLPKKKYKQRNQEACVINASPWKPNRECKRLQRLENLILVSQLELQVSLHLPDQERDIELQVWFLSQRFKLWERKKTYCSASNQEDSTRQASWKVHLLLYLDQNPIRICFIEWKRTA